MTSVLDCNPSLVAEFWDYAKNDEAPENVEVFSKTKTVWFTCSI